MMDTDKSRQWVYGLIFAAIALACTAGPGGVRLWRSLRARRTIRATYAAKLAWAAKRPEIERRVRDQEKATAELDARLFMESDEGDFTQAITAAARAARCAVRSVRPLTSRILGGPETKTTANRSASAQKKPSVEFLERPVRLILQAEYGQVGALLKRLEADTRVVRVRRLKLQPYRNDRKRLHCELEITGYDLRTEAEGDK